jgi:hypothetical protein
MNRFDQYVQQQFVPQFVPTPLDGNLMFRALASKQQGFDTMGANISAFAPEVTAYTGDSMAAKDYLQNTYEAEKIRIQEELSTSGDVSKAARELQGLNSKYLKDRQTGALYNFAQRKAMDDMELERIKSIKNAADKEYSLADYYTNRHTEFNTNEFTPLNRAKIFDDPGMTEKIRGAVQLAAASSIPVEGGEVIFDPKTGEWMLGVTNQQGEIQWEYKKANEIAPLVAEYLAGDSEAMDYIAARESVGAPILGMIEQQINAASQLAAYDKFTTKGGSGTSGKRGGGSQVGDGMLVGGIGPTRTLGKQTWLGNVENSHNLLDEQLGKAKTVKEKREILFRKQELDKRVGQFNEENKELKERYDQARSAVLDKEIKINTSFMDELDGMKGAFLTGLASFANNLYRRSTPLGSVEQQSIEALQSVMEEPIKTVDDLTRKLEVLKEDKGVSLLSSLGHEIGKYECAFETAFKDNYPEYYKAYTTYNSKLAEEIKGKDILVDSKVVTIADKKDRDDLLAAIQPVMTPAMVNEGSLRVYSTSKDAAVTDSREAMPMEVNDAVNVITNLSNFNLSNFKVSFNEKTGQMISFDAQHSKDNKQPTLHIEFAVDQNHESLAGNTAVPTANEFIRRTLANYEGGQEMGQLMDTYDMLNSQGLVYAPGLDVSESIRKENVNVTYTDDKGISLNGKDLTYDDLTRYYAELSEQGLSTSSIEELINHFNNSDEQSGGKLKESDPIKLDKLPTIQGDRASSLLIGRVLSEISPVIEPTMNSTKPRTVNNPFVKFEDAGIRYDESSFVSSTPTISKAVVDNAKMLFDDYKDLIATGGTRTQKAHEEIYKRLGKTPPKNSAHLSGNAIDIRLQGAKFLEDFTQEDFDKYGIVKILGPHNEPSIHSDHYHIQFKS